MTKSGLGYLDFGLCTCARSERGASGYGLDFDYFRHGCFEPLLDANR